MLCTKSTTVPPMTVMSASVKSALASDRVKVMVAVSPMTSCVLLLVTAIVGGWVSVNRVSLLFASAPSALKLPKLSLKTKEATLMVLLPLLPAAGVKVAV